MALSLYSFAIPVLILTLYVVFNTLVNALHAVAPANEMCRKCAIPDSGAKSLAGNSRKGAGFSQAQGKFVMDGDGEAVNLLFLTYCLQHTCQVV